MARQGKIVLFAYGVLIAVDYFFHLKLMADFMDVTPKR
jgi:hypothetical protein